MRRGLFVIPFLMGASFGVEAACIDPETRVASTVSITREFSEAERAAAPSILGIRGTAWFLTPRLIVTAAHVADAMHLTPEDWKTIRIRERGTNESIPVRTLRLVGGSYSEKMAVLELKDAFPGAAALRIRKEPLVPDEPVVSLAYPNDNLRFARGRFVQYGESDALLGAALMEMHDGKDRLVLDHGASGAPVLDCEGRVVAVVSTLVTQTLSLPFGAVRVSTAWQTPNVISVPTETLRDFPASD